MFIYDCFLPCIAIIQLFPKPQPYKYVCTALRHIQYSYHKHLLPIPLTFSHINTHLGYSSYHSPPYPPPMKMNLNHTMTHPVQPSYDSSPVLHPYKKHFSHFDPHCESIIPLSPHTLALEKHFYVIVTKTVQPS